MRRKRFLVALVLVAFVALVVGFAHPSPPSLSTTVTGDALLAARARPLLHCLSADVLVRPRAGFQALLGAGGSVSTDARLGRQRQGAPSGWLERACHASWSSQLQFG
jgi:hypothetical protein